MMRGLLIDALFIKEELYQNGVVHRAYTADVDELRIQACVIAADTLQTRTRPITLRLYTLPYWSNAPFLIFDIRALWRSGLSARAPECQKLKMVD